MLDKLVYRTVPLLIAVLLAALMLPGTSARIVNFVTEMLYCR
mgnify:CR=1 FL=1